MKHSFFIIFLLFLGLSFFVLETCQNSESVEALGIDIQWVGASNGQIIDGSVQFKGIASKRISDKTHLKWTWDFGDKNAVVDEFRKNMQNPFYSYSTYGDFLVSLKVEDTVAKTSESISKVINIKYFDNFPYADITNVTSNIFSLVVRGNTYKGEKYEYIDLNPDYFLEISTHPNFDTLIEFKDGKNHIVLPLNAGYLKTIEELQPGTDYYIRTRTIRNSSFTSGIIEDVSHRVSNTLKVKTLPIPEIKVDVDTTTNAQLVIIKSSLPGLDVSDENKSITVYKDNDFSKIFEPAIYAPDSIFHREPGSTLHFKFRFVYVHPTRNDLRVVKEKIVDIKTPSTLFHYNLSVLHADTTFPLPKIFKLDNESREVRFTGLSTTLKWNKAPFDDGTSLTVTSSGLADFKDPDVGVYFLAPLASGDAFSYLIYSLGGVSYYHESSTANNSNFGNLIVYKEDNEYVYCRMAIPDNYAQGMRAKTVLSSNTQQATNIVYVKGFLLKLKKEF